jgi:hypothetical protein
MKIPIQALEDQILNERSEGSDTEALNDIISTSKRKGLVRSDTANTNTMTDISETSPYKSNYRDMLDDAESAYDAEAIRMHEESAKDFEYTCLPCGFLSSFLFGYVS